jgi:hypothetical protein
VHTEMFEFLFHHCVGDHRAVSACERIWRRCYGGGDNVATSCNYSSKSGGGGAVRRWLPMCCIGAVDAAKD